RVRVRRGAGLPHVGHLRGRRDLVVRLPASRRGGRVGGARADGAAQGSGRGPGEAARGERATALRDRASARRQGTGRAARAGKVALVKADVVLDVQNLHLPVSRLLFDALGDLTTELT